MFSDLIKNSHKIFAKIFGRLILINHHGLKWHDDLYDDDKKTVEQ